MAILIDGHQYEIPGLHSVCVDQDVRLSVGPEDFCPRTSPTISLICIHTTVGDEPVVFTAGAGPGGNGLRYADIWKSDSGRHAASHFLCDSDGTVYNFLDIGKFAAYHATSINQISVGIELMQHKDGKVYEAAYKSCVQLCEWLTAQTGKLSRLVVQKQFHYPHNGAISRLIRGGRDCNGIIGHRDQSLDRGAGDPGDLIFKYLWQAGFEAMDFYREDDKDIWMLRQRMMGFEKADGVVGPKTVAKMVELIGRGTWAR